eukprot:TRINITY_DN62978_c0_g2_i1.p2 TRINITY_DN62978_c0_g2~~TRINITY_DN62978_c0_g2_i1.p2  ORF type:complete len:122 (+),score=15.16 TRINITY_DN62978_c0_g2_i1:112-477(+)
MWNNKANTTIQTSSIRIDFVCAGTWCACTPLPLSTANSTNNVAAKPLNHTFACWGSMHFRHPKQKQMKANRNKQPPTTTKRIGSAPFSHDGASWVVKLATPIGRPMKVAVATMRTSVSWKG